ncbi:MAG TPA: hypothetical protein PK079_23250 [Leptospiraceae bacterium]|nr:hypothetical protein [Leptospiraceae bacterium]HMW06356.1 hypothetical protein [Leptospiraceae bacterium]HMX30965.1 hypothetical protein [Leptospiraceae bacterium]HMY34309.1 hypothetical protein [Leptospiraceae bacterium]HMZ63783.1 hypothetical protein [Leptospiraceae bacterium]
MTTTLKGFIISFSFLLILFLGYILFFGVSGLQELGAVLFILPAFPVVGVLLGFFSKFIQQRRFFKLMGMGLISIYLIALLFSCILVLTDESKSIGFLETISSIFLLGSAGFAIFGSFLLPLLAIGVFLLEKWTRENLNSILPEDN